MKSCDVTLVVNILKLFMAVLRKYMYISMDIYYKTFPP
jgi:hypothetical protein